MNLKQLILIIELLKKLFLIFKFTKKNFYTTSLKEALKLVKPPMKEQRYLLIFALCLYTNIRNEHLRV